jgi:hypothetical protein
MFTRIRIAIGFAVVALLIMSIPVFAKGGFDFITITGPDLKEAVRVSQANLTEDFFTFANFYEDKIKAPVDPGKGYEITRHYVQGVSDIVFDRLHYYPETGFVFYDGIENGDSEYDGEWYTANPEIKTIFESVLLTQNVSAAPAEKEEPATSAFPPQPAEPIAQAEPVPSSFPISILLVIVLGVGLSAVFALAFRRRKPATH